MEQTVIRRRRLRRIFALLLFGVVLALTAGAVWVGESVAAKKIEAIPDYAAARRIMAGDSTAGAIVLVPEQNVVGQPYLLYVPAPNYAPMGHNEHGYRGAIVPVEREPGVVRILFLGGSTTYSIGVARPEDAWPEVSAAVLRKNLPPGVQGLEIINGAVPWGTSAEWVTHYHFKFHYYRPDIVVVNDSGNDADMLGRGYYHPDFSNCRQEIHNVKPLPPKYRWVARSNILSLFLLDCFQVEGVSRQMFVKTELQEKPIVPWFLEQSEDIMANHEYIPQGNYRAFTHNLEMLVREVRDADQCKLLFVPFRQRTQANYPENYKRLAAATDKEFDEVARKFQIPMVPFPADQLIPPEGWFDDTCHLNAHGERIKGEYVAPFLAQLIAELPWVESQPGP